MAEERKWYKELNDNRLSLKAEGVIPIKELFIDEYGKHCTRFTLPKEPPVSAVQMFNQYRSLWLGCDLDKPSDVIIKVNRKRKNLKFNFNN